MNVDPSTLRVAKQISRTEILFGMARVPGSRRVFVGGSEGKVYDFDLAAEKPAAKELARHESYVTSVALAGDQIVSGGYDRKLIWTRIDDAKAVRSIDAHERWIRQVVASPDQKTIASVADDMVCRLWNAADGKLLRELRGHETTTPHHFPSMLYACAFSADGQYLATGDRTGRIVVWEVATGKQQKVMQADGMYTWDPVARRRSIGGIRSLAFSPDGKLLVAGGISKIGNIDHLASPARLDIFNWQKEERVHEILSDARLKGLVEQINFSADGKWFVGAGGGTGGLIVFANATSGKILFQDSAPTHIHGMALSETGDTILAAGHNQLVVWDLTAPATTGSKKA